MRCCWCNVTLTPDRPTASTFPTVEHLRPRALGGKGTDNLDVSCEACNGIRGSDCAPPKGATDGRCSKAWSAGKRWCPPEVCARWCEVDPVDRDKLFQRGRWRRFTRTYLVTRPGDDVVSDQKGTLTVVRNRVDEVTGDVARCYVGCHVRDAVPVLQAEGWDVRRARGKRLVAGAAWATLGEVAGAG